MKKKKNKNEFDIEEFIKKNKTEKKKYIKEQSKKNG